MEHYLVKVLSVIQTLGKMLCLIIRELDEGEQKESKVKNRKGTGTTEVRLNETDLIQAWRRKGEA